MLWNQGGFTSQSSSNSLDSESFLLLGLLLWIVISGWVLFMGSDTFPVCFVSWFILLLIRDITWFKDIPFHCILNRIQSQRLEYVLEVKDWSGCSVNKLQQQPFKRRDRSMAWFHYYCSHGVESVLICQGAPQHTGSPLPNSPCSRHDGACC